MEIIKEDYVGFETAKLLKEKGFDELCIFKYNYEGIRMKAGIAIDEWQNSELDDNEYSCPTLQMAMKWLREVHNIFIDISPTYNMKEKTIHFIWQIFDSNYDFIGDCEIFYNNYEQTCEEAIKFCLEDLI